MNVRNFAIRFVLAFLICSTLLWTYFNLPWVTVTLAAATVIGILAYQYHHYRAQVREINRKYSQK